MTPTAIPNLSETAANPLPPSPGAEEERAVPLLLDVGGMKCAGCVRAVERRLLEQPGVCQASVNLLTSTAWVGLAPGLIAGEGTDADPLPALLESLRSMGFEARPRVQGQDLSTGGQRLKERNWWQRWRQLVTAMLLLLLSTLGHLADMGRLPSTGLLIVFGRLSFHALVATLALAGPGRTILVRGVRSALMGLPSMDTLVAMGVGSAYGASLVGFLWPASGWPCFFNEPVMLLGFVLAGRFLEERARYRTGRALEQLAALQPDLALLVLDDESPRGVPVAGLRPGDRLLILPGDRIPVDGVVHRGNSAVDMSVLTGESLPLQASTGSELAAGSLNLEAPLVLEVSRSGSESALARIIRLVEQAQARKAPIQRLADRVAGRFTLFVLTLAAATFLFWWLWGAHHWPHVLVADTWAHTAHEVVSAAPGHGRSGFGATATTPFALALQLAIAVLVVACPCALGLATPTAISVGCGRAARAGLLFRGGEAIETMSRLNRVLFDKTGTLTMGRPQVTALECFPHHSCNNEMDRLLQVAASLEQHSRHPLAHALLQESRNRDLPLHSVLDCRALPGDGMEGRLSEEGPLCRVGRIGWIESLGITIPADVRERQRFHETAGATLLGVVCGSVFEGLVAVQDQPRPDAALTLRLLRDHRLELGLLSGDRRGSVKWLAALIGLNEDELAWELRPEQKLARIQRRPAGVVVAMVGDGINDAPALAAADVGIAVGTGTQIAQDTADLVVLGDGLKGVVEALLIARRTMAKVRQNLVWAFGYNLVVLPLAAGVLLPAFGLVLSPPLAALLMASSSITVVLNALMLATESSGNPMMGR